MLKCKCNHVTPFLEPHHLQDKSHNTKIHTELPEISRTPPHYLSPCLSLSYSLSLEFILLPLQTCLLGNSQSFIKTQSKHHVCFKF